MGLTLKMLAVLVGIILIAFGIAGLMPMFTTDGLLFGMFPVDQMHSNVYFASGVIALLAATKGTLAKLYFIVFGLIFLAIAILGFMDRTDLLMNMNVNKADNILHLVVGIIFLYFGFLFRR